MTTDRNSFVYILLCADGTLYTGWTTDVAARVRMHNSGRGAKYTRTRLPVRLVYYESAAGKGDALSREAAIKKLTRTQKERLVFSGSNLLSHEEIEQNRRLINRRPLRKKSRKT